MHWTTLLNILATNWRTRCANDGCRSFPKITFTHTYHRACYSYSTNATLDTAFDSLVSQARQRGLQQQQQQQGAAGGSRSRSGLGNREADGGWCISWCKDRYWGEVTTVGCGTNGILEVLSTLYFLAPNIFTETHQFIDHTIKPVSFNYSFHS